MKLLNTKGEFISGAEGEEVLRIAEEEDFEFAQVTKIGRYEKKDGYIQKHIQEILKLPLVDAQAVHSRGFRVVVDAVNSTGGIAVPMLLSALGVTVKELHCEPTGHFPHNPEPLPEKGPQEIRQANRSFNQMVDDLQQVESRNLPQAARFLDLARPARARTRLVGK